MYGQRIVWRESFYDLDHKRQVELMNEWLGDLRKYADAEDVLSHASKFDFDLDRLYIDRDVCAWKQLIKSMGM